MAKSASVAPGATTISCDTATHPGSCDTATHPRAATNTSAGATATQQDAKSATPPDGNRTGLTAGELCLGRLLECGADGRVRVSYSIAGNDLCAWAEALAPLPAAASRPLVLGFLQADPARPVVLGVLATALDAVLAVTPGQSTLPETVRIEATQAIELACGGALVKLSASGRVLIEGRAVTSRADTANRLLGATVEIN